FSLGEDGTIDPNAANSLTATDELADADLMVLFLRFRRPDEASFQHILSYLKSGKPVVAFRTSTHGFRFSSDSPFAGWGFQKDPTFVHSYAGGELTGELLGQKWITHHGHFSDGDNPLTSVTVDASAKRHPILRGVESFDAYSWLYHVQGGGDSVSGDPQFLLNGKSLRSKKEQLGQLNRYPISNPVAWTKTHNHGFNRARVFTTTLGHPYDFKDPMMRRFALQGMLWALSKEELIPAKGVGTDTVGEYDPNNSGFGKKYKAGLKPEDLIK
ncbi:MAG: ThuA domain-containing protein, partial [Verrucomicrobiota bacterium]